MRYIIYGAGGVGGVVGGKLHLAGIEVVLIARGQHLEAIQRDGLKLKHPNPETTEALRIRAVSQPSEIDFREGDIVVLTMKSQDTVGALEDLRLAAGDEIPVVCFQNGVENERQAARRFTHVYGVMTIMPANYLEPGFVDTTAWPVTGVVDIGRFPKGTDEITDSFAADMSRAGFVSEANPEIMRVKYTKLFQNMVNATQALFDPEVDSSDVLEKLREEAAAAFGAAGIHWATTEEMMGRASAMRGGAPAGIGRSGWRGGSTWQSIARGAGSSETDYLNGEVVLLGHLHGVPTPANEAVQLYIDRMAKTRAKPGSVDIEDVRAEIARREGRIAIK